MKVYVTKYALTKGILEREGELTGIPDLIKVKQDGFINHDYFHKGQWFTDPEEARKKAYEMLANKIKSVKKSLSKLEKMKF